MVSIQSRDAQGSDGLLRGSVLGPRLQCYNFEDLLMSFDLPMNDVPDARIELGRLLFFDPILSVDDQTACATCHSEIWGMGDGIPRAVGHGAGLNAGPAREGPNMLRRNSPALYNLAFRSSLLWDGREQVLEEQALVPLFAEDELSADRETLLEELSSVPEYEARFADAFPECPTITIDPAGP